MTIKQKTPITKPEKPNKNKSDFNQRQLKAERMSKIAALIHAGKSQTEIAEMLQASQGTISDDCKKLREKWMQQAVETIDDWKARELAYCIEQRTQAQIQWQATKQSRFQDIMIRWTDRIAKILGLDAPIKFQNIKADDLRKQAIEQGLDPDADAALSVIYQAIKEKEEKGWNLN